MKASAISELQNQGPADFHRNRRARMIDMLRVGSLLAFGMALWMANLLPIQKGILICESNALVSEARWSHLAQLSGRDELDSASIRWVSSSHTPLSAGVSGPHNTSVGDSIRHLKLRMGLHGTISAMELQQELNRLTNPASPNSPEPRQPRLHKERWQVQVAQHALSLFRLDCERRGVSIAETTVTSPFRLASNSTDPSEPEGSGVTEGSAVMEDIAVMEKLTRNLADAERALAIAALGDQTPVLSAAGPLALTGSPTFYVQGSRPSLLHAVGLIVIALGVSWCGCRWAMARSLASNHSRFGKSQHSMVDSHRAYTSLLSRLGIPYLGEIHLAVKHSAPEQDQENSLSAPHSRSMSRWSKVARWTDGILMLWVACFILRYSVDPMWRELLFRAPLAAFSYLVSGI